MINHCLDAACAAPSRAVAYKMHTVCFSHELLLHLNVCNEKPVIACEVQYSLPDETQGLSLQPQLHVIYYVKIFFKWSVCPVQLPLHLKKKKNRLTYTATGVSHFYRGGKEEGKMQKSSSS